MDALSIAGSVLQVISHTRTQFEKLRDTFPDVTSVLRDSGTPAGSNQVEAWTRLRNCIEDFTELIESGSNTLKNDEIQLNKAIRCAELHMDRRTEGFKCLDTHLDCMHSDASAQRQSPLRLPIHSNSSSPSNIASSTSINGGSSWCRWHYTTMAPSEDALQRDPIHCCSSVKDPDHAIWSRTSSPPSSPLRVGLGLGALAVASACAAVSSSHRPPFALDRSNQTPLQTEPSQYIQLILPLKTAGLVLDSVPAFIIVIFLYCFASGFFYFLHIHSEIQERAFAAIVLLSATVGFATGLPPFEIVFRLLPWTGIVAMAFVAVSGRYCSRRQQFQSLRPHRGPKIK
jgi:hypothetical protein